MVKKFLVVCLAVFMAVGMASVASAAPTVTFDVPTDPILPGDIFSVGVSVKENTGGMIGLLTFGAFIDYNDNYLRFVSAEVDSTWKDHWVDPDDHSKGTTDSGFFHPENDSRLWTKDGWANYPSPPAPAPFTAPDYFEEGSDLLQSAFIDLQDMFTQHFANEIVLGTITFECVGAGDSLLYAHERKELNDLVSGSIISADIDWESSFATVSQVPIPGAALLLGSGLLGLVGLRRKFSG